MIIATDPSTAWTFDTADCRVLAVAGDPDKLALYDPDTPHSALTMVDPLDLRDYR